MYVIYVSIYHNDYNYHACSRNSVNLPGLKQPLDDSFFYLAFCDQQHLPESRQIFCIILGPFKCIYSKVFRLGIPIDTTTTTKRFQCSYQA